MSDTGQKIENTNQGYVRIENINGRIVVFDGTDHRMIIGLLPDGTVAIVISKEGEDVFDALGY